MPEETLVKVEEVEAGRDEAEARKIEQLVMAGDYGALSVRQRVTYVEMLCDRLGISWHSQPFAWIVLNGKLTLYATRNATDQLRSSRGISINIVDRARIEGDVFLVRALATMQDGRTDESVGAISVQGLGGENLANALMKAETKAKRRVTLSICGLSFMDELEVDSLRAVRQEPKPEGIRRIAPAPLTAEVREPETPIEAVGVSKDAAVNAAVNVPQVEAGKVEAKVAKKYPPATAPIRAKI